MVGEAGLLFFFGGLSSAPWLQYNPAAVRMDNPAVSVLSIQKVHIVKFIENMFQRVLPNTWIEILFLWENCHKWP